MPPSHYMINFSLRHNVLCFSLVVVLYSFYAIIKVVLLDETGCHVYQELEAYVSVNSKPDHSPAGEPRGFARFHCSGVGISPNFHCPGDRGFESEKFPTVLKEKCRNFSICFKETGAVCKAGIVSYQFLQKQ